MVEYDLSLEITVKCNYCNGTGKLKAYYINDLKACHNCNGTGKIDIDRLPELTLETRPSDHEHSNASEEV